MNSDELNYGEPIWISVRDVNHYFSIGKTRCYELIKEGKIETKLDKKRGSKKGKRLIRFDSVAAYIEDLPTYDEDGDLALPS